MPQPFAAAGELSDAYAAVDWSATSLGPVETWTTTLRSCVDLVLRSRFPLTLLWGPELVLIYNLAYVELIGDKHPRALGRPAAEVFPEAWDQVGPMLEGVLAGDDATWYENEPVPLERNGFLEYTTFTFSYSPVRGEGGRIEGVIDISTETTGQVVTARRLAALTRLHQDLTAVRRVGEVADVVRSALAEAAEDVLSVDLEPAPARSRAADAEEIELSEGPHGPVARVLVGVAGAPEHDTVLALGLSPVLRLDDGYLDFVRLVGFALSRNLERLVHGEAERLLSTALQASLLSRPQHSLDVDVAVRYQPAAEVAQVGGDWYDAFRLADGATTVVVGDVSGHDSSAAASMGQLRNLLRGVALHDGVGPAATLTALDRTVERLDVHTLATAVVAELRPDTTGGMTMRWASAGHLPPVLLHADRRVEALWTTPELMVGLEPDSIRTDHEIALPAGSTVVFYTDGLVERRGIDLDTGIARLTTKLETCHGLAGEALCDLLLSELGTGTEDDVVLLVVTVPPA